MTTRYRSFAFTLLTAATLILTSCDDFGDGFSDSKRFKEDFHYTYSVKPGAKLSLENLNGAVEISGWEKDSVEVNGSKYASTEAILNGLKIDVVASEDFVRIRTIPPSGHRGNRGASYMIRVPRRMELERIVSSNGGIRLEDLDGPARLRTSNGGVRVLRLRGPVEVLTSNARVELNDQTGGAVVHTSNGSINARLRDPERGKTIKLESSNGGIDLTLDSLNDNDIQLNTSNSSIDVRLPGGAHADLKASTSNGRVTSDFNVAVKSGEMSKAKVEGTIGAGGSMAPLSQMDLSTSNGSIRIHKL